MTNFQDQRFKYINHDDPLEGDKLQRTKHKNKFADFDSNSNIIGISGGLGWKSLQKSSLGNSRSKKEQIDEEQRQKDRKIKKLTNINKHLLQQLKEQNDELSKRVEKQKFRIPKKSLPKSQPKNQEVSKQLEGIKRELENAYRQIEFYKESIINLKAKEMFSSQIDKIVDHKEKLRQKNEEIQMIQQEIKTQRAIKSHQDKQLGKIKNQEMTEVINQLDNDIKSSKIKLKEVKKNLLKREELQKKQHMYLSQLQILVKKSINNQEDQKISGQKQSPQKILIHQEISESQWKQIKEKLAQQKKKYDQNGKKLTYQNYMKSKQSKTLEQMELKYKQKTKILQKLTSKLNEVDKLARLRPKPEIIQIVDMKMQKLKDIISRQSSIEMSKANKIKTRNLSENARDFKKWELEHASTSNELEQKINIIKSKLQSDEGSASRNEFDVLLTSSKEEVRV